MKFTAEVKMDNDAFCGELGAWVRGLSFVLDDIRDKIQFETKEATLLDSNGNTVGEYKIEGEI